MKVPQKRIDRSVRYMKRFLGSEDGSSFALLDADAQVLYILGLLVCDDVGFIKKAKLDKAAADPDFRFAAALIADRVGLLVGETVLDRYA